MAGFKERNSIRQHNTDKYVLSLNGIAEWDPSAAMYSDQTDFNRVLKEYS
jgi:hypothetical protein